MKLEVGMYCYNKTNRKLGIGKIIDFQCNNNVKISYKNDSGFSSIGNVIASFNIIDILEVGDYVNESKILGFENEYIEEDDKYVPFGVITENCYLDNNKSWIIEKEIKSAVTKEQFESMKYEVGE
jgi:hypothetical protein|nr:MAG TPA: hypothetical protein [Caudoviricetes sp.]